MNVIEFDPKLQASPHRDCLALFDKDPSSATLSQATPFRIYGITLPGVVLPSVHPALPYNLIVVSIKVKYKILPSNAILILGV